MDPCIKDILDHLKGLGYTFKKNYYRVADYYLFKITPPRFPYEGVGSEEKVIEYVTNEHNRLVEILKPNFKTTNFYVSIKKPYVNPYPFIVLGCDQPELNECSPKTDI